MKSLLVKLSVIIMLSLTSVSPLFARDIFADLMKDSVATFADATDLMYYSVKSLIMASSTPDPNLTTVQQREAQKLLAERGIVLEDKNQPIQRASVAKALIRRFNLSTSFLTGLMGFDSLYYKDALRLGLFEDEKPSDATLTTRELLKAYFKAQSLHKDY